MAVDVRVPTTGNAGEDAIVVEWSVKVGDDVSAGDVLVVLETAKSTIDIEAPASGRVLDIRYEPGEEVPEHEVLAILGEPGEQLERGDSGGRGATHDDDVSPSTPAAGGSSMGSEDASNTQASSEVERGSRLRISPRARALAAERGLDVSGITGTGPFGRIVIEDVRHAVSPETAGSAGAPVAESESGAATSSPFTLIPVRGARKVTAQRMHESLSSTAQVTLTRYADANHLLAFVSRLRQVTDVQKAGKIGVNDVLLYAVARVVARHPEANSWFAWDGIKQFHDVNLGFAVDTGQALLVPVIRGADTLSLGEIARAARTSINKARSGAITADDMAGGTFTLTNLGSLGVHWFTPVLNPPQSCILGVGAAHRSAPDAPALLPLSLTFDHRALDGAAAAKLLADLADGIATVDVLAAL
ncbi:pyruvate dehydrogenase E2 component (dihydrolipoamide acetyltransferase) [Microcella alkaliphila]|uniref:Dihydrolipoamide acetyltransferase component of pyruvate dehydrogenase complex n=1 Tax=Microcella alkaliphila TaxID=279828 RepID=A0A4V2FMZ7_9MICO|nr:pyruvate dehydrogenase E2 component (dihydrolipoamide acetyltransferase) [Microcella alkaliphila]